MPRYKHYTENSGEMEQWLLKAGFTVFLMRDVDDTVMSDLEVVEWAAAQGEPVHVDPYFWNHPVVHSRYGNDYHHGVIVDSFDSSVVMFRDRDLGMAFKLKFC